MAELLVPCPNYPPCRSKQHKAGGKPLRRCQKEAAGRKNGDLPSDGGMARYTDDLDENVGPDPTYLVLGERLIDAGLPPIIITKGYDDLGLRGLELEDDVEIEPVVNYFTDAHGDDVNRMVAAASVEYARSATTAKEQETAKHLSFAAEGFAHMGSYNDWDDEEDDPTVGAFERSKAHMAQNRGASHEVMAAVAPLVVPRCQAKKGFPSYPAEYIGRTREWNARLDSIIAGCRAAQTLRALPKATLHESDEAQKVRSALEDISEGGSLAFMDDIGRI